MRKIGQNENGSATLVTLMEKLSMKTLILIMAIFVSAQASANAQVLTQIVKNITGLTSTAGKTSRIQKKVLKEFLDRQVIKTTDDFGRISEVKFHQTLDVKNLELTMTSLKPRKRAGGPDWTIKINHVDSLVEGFKKADIDRLIKNFLKSKGLKGTQVKNSNLTDVKHMNYGMLNYKLSSRANDSFIEIELIDVSRMYNHGDVIAGLLEKISTKYLNFSNSAAALL